MKEIGGMVLVIACVLGGFVLHHGNLMLLVIPTEYLIIGGMAFGAMIITSPLRVVFQTFKALLGLIKGGGVSRKHYLELLLMLYELFQLSRKEGVLALEGHVNEPQNSSILQKYPSFTKDRHAVAFLCDTLKLFVAGVLEPHGMDELMERDLEVIHHEEMEPSHALSKVADALPAIGIVACVLGIILTMQSIDKGAAAVGSNVAGALVGTFFGVFLAYGFVGPLSGSLECVANSKQLYYQCIRHVVTAAVSGINPPMAIELGRRSIATAHRPSFEELEEAVREVKSGGGGAGGGG